MKTVLIIGADFVPSSMPPATRIRFFSNYLAQLGWCPIVLTTKPEYYEWPVDEENARLIPEALEVVRTRAFPAARTRRLGVGDLGLRSLWHHWQAIKRLCSKRQVDLLFIPVPPYFSMLLGRLAHRKFGIPYVIDYIDPWVTHSYRSVPRDQRPPKWFLSDKVARFLEPVALKNVSHITGVSTATTDNVVQRYKWLNETYATEIPYGAEAADFDYIRRHPRPNSIFNCRDGFTHLSYVGACIPAMYATVRALFKAVKLGLEQEPAKFERLRLHFVGTSYAANGHHAGTIDLLAREAGIANNVDEQPDRVSYLESLQVMLDSDALFLLGSDAVHYTASKVFPYILAQRPMLAIFNEESSVVSIMREARAGELITFVTGADPADSYQTIFKRLSLLLSDEYEMRQDWAAFQAYCTREMTKRLVDVLDHAIAKHRSSIMEKQPNAGAAKLTGTTSHLPL